MSKKRVILVAVDFSDTSDRALRQAHLLSKTLDKDLYLLYVVEKSLSRLSFFSRDEKTPLDSIRTKMEELKARAEKFSGQQVLFEIAQGKPYEQILQKAVSLDAAFIVLGARGDVSGKDNHHYVGTNASRVTRSAPCPVITVNNKVTCHSLRTILLPLDLTRETRQKVTNAIELANRFKAKIKVMSAITHKIDEAELDQLTRISHQVTDFISKSGIECTDEMVKSTPDAQSEVPIILKYADEQGDIDIILIMTQPELGVFDFILSPNAIEMLRRSPYPVMSILPKNLERTSIMPF